MSRHRAHRAAIADGRAVSRGHGRKANTVVVQHLASRRRDPVTGNAPVLRAIARMPAPLPTGPPGTGRDTAGAPSRVREGRRHGHRPAAATLSSANDRKRRCAQHYKQVSQVCRKLPEALRAIAFVGVARKAAITTWDGNLRRLFLHLGAAHPRGKALAQSGDFLQLAGVSWPRA